MSAKVCEKSVGSNRHLFCIEKMSFDTNSKYRKKYRNKISNFCLHFFSVGVVSKTLFKVSLPTFGGGNTGRGLARVSMARALSLVDSTLALYRGVQWRGMLC